ncbi:MAG: hypothetical protein B1H11_13075 [Desulfobacteraceae bacterium 4484_190.1]|nr:MAG: hypothetical protein B1H11_13075 [Desulfobacteraceae bacterium 4484_190.1]
MGCLGNVVKRMKRQGISDVVSLDVGEPCFDTPPNIKWAAWEALQPDITACGATAGDHGIMYQIRQNLSWILRKTIVSCCWGLPGALMSRAPRWQVPMPFSGRKESLRGSDGHI